MAMPPQAPDHWERVKEITYGALECPVAERQSWLAEACGADEALRLEVDSLLAAHDEAGPFLQTDGFARPGAAEAIAAAARQSVMLAAGRRIGSYQIVREIGHGGMGVVYLARRADAAFEKEVAIKVIRSGFGGDVVLRRFRDERRILATLDHPNVARLLDGATTDDGLPYVVMEYVDGVPFDIYCDTARLSLTRRLELFRQVCAAVQYAHQRLVIHRDIKARNILVTAAGTPKLLDFGIAKLLEPGAVPEAQTRTGFRAFTLDGASPEQIRGEPITVTSDVYALGVLLYQLMTGRRPHGSTPLSDTDLMRAICEDPPARPTAAAREGTRFDVSVELEWVVLKALRKEPDRRYGSVEQLAEDIRRFLSGLPVLAAPDSRRYRARKFVGRNRLALAAAALIFVSLAAGLAMTLWQARIAERERGRAERRFNDVRKVANSLIFEIHDGIEELPGSTAVRQLLVRRAVEYLDSLAREPGDDRALQRELAVALQKVGDVQGHPSRANLGDLAGALVSHRKALSILEALSASDPADVRSRRNLANSYSVIGDLEFAAGGGSAVALDNYRKALLLREGLSSADPTDLSLRLDLVRSHKRVGNMSDAADAAMTSYRRAEALCEELFASQPLHREVRSELAAMHERLGYELASRGEMTAAMEKQDRALEMRQALAAQDPTNITFRRGLRRATTTSATCSRSSMTRRPLCEATAGCCRSIRS